MMGAECASEAAGPQPLFLVGLLSLVSGAVLLLGALALLSVRVLNERLFQASEVQLLDRELDDAVWNASENPLFREAKTTFQNPIYAGRLPANPHSRH